MLDDVKARLGIFYSEPFKDNEVQTMIDGAKAYLMQGYMLTKQYRA